MDGKTKTNPPRDVGGCVMEQSQELWEWIYEIQKKLKPLDEPHRTIHLLETLKSTKSSGLDDLQVWWLIVDTWVESKTNSSTKYIWEEVFSLRKVPSWYTDHLPENMNVYRGGDPSGVSWTLCNEKGQWFAERYRKNQKFWGMTISKKDVLFYTNLREEEEVVIVPKDYHQIREIGYCPRYDKVA